jgi:hypothetical protein
MYAATNSSKFSDLEKAFKERFLGVDEAAVENAYTSCTQAKGENVMDYAQRFQAIVTRLYGKHQEVGPVQRGIIRQFVSGLNADIQRWVSSKPLDSLHDAISAAVWEESAVAMTKRRGTGAESEKSEKLASALERALAKIEGAAKKWGLSEEDEDLERDLLQAFMSAKPKGPGACYKCGGIGHLKRDCPTKGSDAEEGGKPCPVCGRKGHTEDVCFVKKYGPTARKPGVKCEECGRLGHASEDCYTRKAREEREARGRDNDKKRLNSTRP